MQPRIELLFGEFVEKRGVRGNVEKGEGRISNYSPWTTELERKRASNVGGSVVLYDGDVNCADLSSRDGITKYVSGRPSGKWC